MCRGGLINPRKRFLVMYSVPSLPTNFLIWALKWVSSRDANSCARCVYVYNVPPHSRISSISRAIQSIHASYPQSLRSPTSTSALILSSGEYRRLPSRALLDVSPFGFWLAPRQSPRMPSARTAAPPPVGGRPPPAAVAAAFCPCGWGLGWDLGEAGFFLPAVVRSSKSCAISSSFFPDFGRPAS